MNPQLFAVRPCPNDEHDWNDWHSAQDERGGLQRDCQRPGCDCHEWQPSLELIGRSIIASFIAGIATPAEARAYLRRRFDRLYAKQRARKLRRVRRG